MARVYAERERRLRSAVDELSCVACRAEPRTVVLLPCAHLALCGVCSRKLPKNECPVCRAFIERKQDVLVP